MGLYLHVRHLELLKSQFCFLFKYDKREKEKAIKPHDRLVLVRTRITALTRPAYQPGSLPGVFRGLATRETLSWEELGT